MSAAVGTHADARHLELVTPEGIPLRFRLATVGDRVVAFLYDLLLFGLAAAALGLLAMLAGTALSELVAVFTVLTLFVLRMFYFTIAELRGHGTTWGKRRMSLRVIDRHGGTLRADAIFARNFMREIELFLPLAALLAPELLLPSATGVVYLAATLWLGLAAALPLLNAQRLRPGDLVGGTVVVVTPRTMLLSDLSDPVFERRTAAPAVTFTDGELEHYGVYELHVLEELLRTGSTREPDGHERLAATIRRKIGRDPARDADIDSLTFLRAFYDAQRAHLEARMLMGTRRERKRR
jgi:uncharacterized RDD family membrane protein YckC